jgi:DNA-binding transcriptional LysR family regulator
MRQDILGLNKETEAHLRIAAVPSAMPIVARLTVPFQLRHPKVRFSFFGRSSNAVLDLLHQREIDAGMTYLDNEPVPEVTSLSLYNERYFLLTTVEGPFGQTDLVRWSQLAGLPLCLVTRDLQHRRITDVVLKESGHDFAPMIETDSIFGLMCHVQTGQWVSIVSQSMVDSVRMTKSLRAVPIVEPVISHTIGLVVSDRFPVQPAVASLMKLASSLTQPLVIKTM